MKNKAFTLIELLAVLVILAILALITTPIVLNIIEDTNKSAAELSMSNIEKAVKLYYSDKELTGAFNGTTFTCKGGRCTNGEETLEVDGKLPENGTIKIDNKGNITFDSILLNGYSCIKENKFVCKRTSKLSEVNKDGFITLNEANPDIDANYKIYGNSVQEGTPSPSTPVSIKSVGDLVTDTNDPNYGKYKIPIKISGKNILNKNESLIAEIRDEMPFSAWANVAFDNKWVVSNLKPSTNYTISYDVECISIPEHTSEYVYGATVGLLLYSGIGDNTTSGLNESKFLQKDEKIHIVRTFTTPDNLNDVNAKYRLLVYTNRYLNGSEAAMSTMRFTNIQIEENDKESSFEPYIEPTTTNIYLDEPLRCVGEVCDYIDFESGKVVRKVKEVIIDGTTKKVENVYFHSRTGLYYAVVRIQNGINGSYDVLLNTHFKSELTAVKIGNSYVTSNGELHSMVHPNQELNTVALWDNWLKEQYNAGTPVHLYYALATPTEEKIELPKIKLNKDVTNIIIDTKVKPSKIELNYYK